MNNTVPAQDVSSAVQGIDAVFNCATPPPTLLDRYDPVPPPRAFCAPSLCASCSELHMRVTVHGNRILLQAGKRAGVKVCADGNHSRIKVIHRACTVQKFILTGSADVVYEGVDVVDGTEVRLEFGFVVQSFYVSLIRIRCYSQDLPYARRFVIPYIEAKVQQEKDVLAENSLTFATVSLRPTFVYGPHDTLVCALPHSYPQHIMSVANVW